MAFTFLNDPETAAPSDQIEPDARDFEIMLAGIGGTAAATYGQGPTGVQSGCAVTAQGSPDQTVAVAAGVVRIGGRKVTVAGGNVSLSVADATNPRIDLITVDTAALKGVTDGTASADPVYPTLPAGKVILAQVFRAANDNTIQTADITDKRVLIDEPPVESVKWYGAKGDGSTNDFTAITAAASALPANGGTILFPPGDYIVGSTWTPPNSTVILGCHTPRWESVANSTSACKLRMQTGFTDAALITLTSTSRGITFQNIALVGNAIGVGKHGVRLPASSSGEMYIRFRDVTINGFTGSGITGRLHTGIFTGCHISMNDAWGILADNGENWVDTHMAFCYIYFNDSGGVKFEGTASTQGCTFTSMRVERNGGLPGFPLTPTNSNAPGWLLKAALKNQWIGCMTDANTGAGVEILVDAATNGVRVNNLDFEACFFNRDGVGDQSTLRDGGGIDIRGFSGTSADRPSRITFFGGGILTGKPDDGGSGLTSPKYGIWMQDAEFVVINSPFKVEGVTASYNFGTPGAGSIWKPSVNDIENKLMTFQRGSTASRPTVMPGGSSVMNMYYDSTLQKLIFYDGTDWRDSFGLAAPAAGNAITQAIVDAKGDILAATAADTVARLAVGTNGQKLEADSVQSAGVKWASTTFTVGGCLDGGSNAPTNGARRIWDAPFACTVTDIVACIDAGTNAVINAQKNGTLDLRSVDATVTGTSLASVGGTLQNTAFASGDDLSIEVVSTSGAVTKVTIQVNFTRP